MSFRYIVFGALFLVSSGIFADDFVGLSAGQIGQEYKYEMAASNGVSILKDETTDRSSAGVLGVSYLKILNEKYLMSADFYMPNTDADSYLILEFSPAVLLYKNNFYAGFSVGYQQLEDTDSETAIAIGASKSKLSLDGFVAGINVGILLLNGSLDIKYKLRLINGTTDYLYGSLNGVDYSADIRLIKTSQVTIGYNFKLN